MPDTQKMMDELEITIRARLDYASVDAYQKALQARHLSYHQMAFPPNGDQWPQDKTLRPNKLHITQNKIQPVLYTESRIESIPPRITLDPDTVGPEDRAQAEKAEQTVIKWLDFSGWDVWLPELTLCKATYGKSIMKPYWNEKDKRPDVSVIEQPALLLLGYGSSDYQTVDWALYEYSISPFEAMRRFPELDVAPPQRSGGPLIVTRLALSDHSDPLGQGGPVPGPGGPLSRNGQTFLSHLSSDYESKQVRIWDYWFKDDSGGVHNAFFVEQVLAGPVKAYPEYPTIPFLVVEHDHEPGSPEGVGEVERLMDSQVEINRALSHWGQLILDEIDPAWELNADSVPPGSVPRGGQVIATGSESAHFKEIEKTVNQFPIEAFVSELQAGIHFETGIPDIMFGKAAGSQTAGRALDIQTGATANRVDVRRRRLYDTGLKKLIEFWVYMALKRGDKFEIAPGEVDEKTGEQAEPVTATYKDIFGEFRHWKIVAPEITPRDGQELVTSTVALLNAKLISVEEAMDRIGVNSPLEMMAKIEKERLNPKYFPGDSQAYVAALALTAQYVAQQGQQPAGVPGQGGSPAADAAPGGNSGPPLPPGQQGDNGASVPGSPPPAAGPPSAGLGTNQSLIRAQPNGSAQVLQQTKTSY